MKKKFLLVLMCFFVSVCFGQVAGDIFDPFYEDLTDWENVGLINDAPNMRPLPLQEVKRILEIVKEIGNERDRRVATEHYNRFFGRMFHFGAAADLDVGFFKNSKRRSLNISPLLDFNLLKGEYFSVSSRALLHLVNKLPDEEPLPRFTFSKRNIVVDDVKVGRIKILPAFNSGVTLGKAKYYFSANFARTCFGPFYNSGIYVSSSAHNQGQFNFVLNFPKVAYMQSLLVLAGTNDDGKERGPHKFLSTHSLTVRPLSWLSFGVRDSVVFGKRFEPAYLIPISVFMVSQGLFGFPDNCLIGMDFTIKPIDGLRLDGAIYMDDMGFNEMIKFKKKFKARMSGEFGISYTMPEKHWFKSASLDYTFVMPYTYAHIAGVTGTTRDKKELNYDNYTHMGKNLGTNLNPNSDRINLRLQFEPVDSLKITLTDTFIRHANINESVDDPLFFFKYMSENYNTSGTALNHATIQDPRRHLFLKETPFMKQKTIEYINQLSLDFSTTLPIKRSGGHMRFFLGYCFEADINPGVNNHMFKAIPEWKDASFDESTCEITLADKTTKVSKTELLNKANEQLQAWRKDARGKNFNHYLKIGASFSY